LQLHLGVNRPGRFNGVIGGSPCQDFSRARRDPPSGEGQEMLGEFLRVVEAAPDWWLLENVPGAPSIEVAGYSHQRIDIDARDLGLRQRRLRYFQFGHRAGLLLALARPSLRGAGEATCMASESNKPGRRDFAEFCALQGSPRSFDLPGLTLAAKYRAVGNGVHIEVARFVARAVARPGLPDKARLPCHRIFHGFSHSLLEFCTFKESASYCNARTWPP
jgi:DNA (cytosine-5)-methyltransferase 1